MIQRAVAAALLSLWASVGAGAQSAGALGAQIDRVRTGTVRMTFAARDGVCGNGMSWYRTRSGSFSGTVINGNWSGARDVDASCERGPVRLVIVRKDGETTELRSYVGGTWKADTGITDLGNVRAADAVAYLLRLAENAPAKPARSAISAATLADSVDAAPVLLRIAKDESRPNDVRSSALNWLGEVVGDKVASTLDSIAYETGDREVRKQAIFAMSRRPADESIPALLKMAETLPDRELRKTAVFWLAQSRDPRAISWMERRIGR
jgi:HEAT repeats